MNADDTLLRATRALRDATDGASPDAARTRARVLAGGIQRTRRVRLVRALLPIAAVLVVSTAWADTHGLLAAAIRRVASFPWSSHSVPRAVAPQPQTPAPPLAREPAPAAAPEVPLVSVDALPRASGAAPARSAFATSRATQATAEGAVVQPSSSREEELTALYAAAHQAHFVDHDSAAALRAWDAYLLAAPDGAFAPEARYNRAIALVRLGRIDEAREALAPFAGGAYGTYRAREARELIDALR